MSAQDEVIQFPFLAPVPRGHEVLIGMVRQAPDSDVRASFVLDRTSGLLHCSERLWGPFGADPAALVDPVAVLGRWSWVFERVLAGHSLGAIVMTQDDASRSRGQTRLFVAPAVAQPYR